MIHTSLSLCARFCLILCTFAALASNLVSFSGLEKIGVLILQALVALVCQAVVGSYQGIVLPALNNADAVPRMLL